MPVLRVRLGLVALVCSACNPGLDLIEHPEGDAPDSAEDGSSGGGTTSVWFAGGNYPEPAMEECGGLPGGVDALPGLATAYAVTGPRPNSWPYLGVDSDIVRLRLSSLGMQAGDRAPQADGRCTGWTIAFDIPAALLAPGAYPIEEVAPSYPELYEGLASEDGCAVDLGTTGPPFATGELVIATVSDACVVGELRGIDFHWRSGAPSPGGFVAQRERVGCVPIDRADCL
jgi:hypothetical protein